MIKKLKKHKTHGIIYIPSSKSQTIRALLIATFSKNKSIIHNALDSQDTRSCIEGCRLFGAKIKEEGSTIYVDATEVGVDNKPLVIDCGNSGTTLYLALGLAASLNKKVTFTGDQQLQKRPLGALLQAYRDLGCKVENTNYPPFTIEGPITGGKTSIECPTSQYLSSLLLAATQSQNECEIIAPVLFEKPYVKLTLGWLDSQKIKYTEQDDLQYFKIKGNQKFSGFESTIAGDFSSATFFFCLAAICKTEITVKGLNKKDEQGDKHTLDILEKMGCIVEWGENQVTVKGPKELKGGTFSLNSMPDALPALCMTAAYSKETVIFNDTPQARMKETDRIAVMSKNLTALGVSVEELEDGIIIKGTGKVKGGSVSGFEDHRIIMAMAIGAMGADDEVVIDDIDAVKVTFPKFFELLESLMVY